MTTLTELNSYEQMLSKKLEIEQELNELGKILEAENNIGMHGNLIDAEGYPRADIDIYKVRMTRQKINCLQNDYNSLLVRIEKELVSIHSLMTNSDQTKVNLNTNGFVQPRDSSSHLKAFIRIDQVDAGSPSFEAGLQKNDLVLQFGPCTHANTKSDLSDLASFVKQSANKIILVKISRKTSDERDEVTIKKLVPKTWNGNGLLGCKLVKIN